jgi:hypothetical protein
VFNVSTCFGHYLPILRRHYTDAELVVIVCSCRCGLVSGCGKTADLLILRSYYKDAELVAIEDVGWSYHILRPTHIYNSTQHQFCVRVVPPDDGQVMPKTRRDIEHL